MKLNCRNFSREIAAESSQVTRNRRVFAHFYLFGIFVIFLVKSQWKTVKQCKIVVFSRIFMYFEFSYFSREIAVKQKITVVFSRIFIFLMISQWITVK